MARAAKSTRTTKSAAAARKPGRPAKVARKSAVKATKPPVAPRNTAARRPAVAAPALAPKLGTQELRAQVEKLERANATLRAKSRETNKAAKAAAARIDELEDRVAQLGKRTALKLAPTPSGSKPKSPTAGRSKRQSRGIEPDATIEEPAHADEDAETVIKNLEEPVSGE